MSERYEDMDDLKRIEDKMAAYVDKLTGHSNGMFKTAAPSSSMRNSSFKRYRSSFLSMSDMELPSNYRDIFRWCRYYFKVDSLIGIAVRSMATFPVTDYVVQDSRAAEEDESIETGDDSKTQEFYERMLKDQRLTKLMQEIGYDYFLYGNCIIFGETHTVDVKRRDEMGEIQTVPEVTWKSLERLDLTRVRIMVDPKTRKRDYFYDIPAHLKRILADKRPKAQYDKIPAIFKKAYETNSLVRLNRDNLFHFSMPTESGDEGLWATPPVLHALKLVMYTNVLRQAQEAIAYEHIIPKRVYYMQNSGDLNSNLSSFSRVAQDFASQLTKQLTDPNFQIVSPIPIQEIQHGGNGRNLLLVPEIEQLQKSILAAMGIPYEFIFGGMSYSGSTVSLRFLENQFITYRQLLEEFINDFMIKRLAEIRGDWETVDDDDKLIKVELTDLKMQDDLQQKQLLFQMNQAGKIPDEYMWEKGFGLEAGLIRDQLYNEREEQIKESVKLAVFQQEMQTKLAEKGIQVPAAPEGDAPAEPPSGQPQEEEAPPGPDGQAGALTEQELIQAAQELARLDPQDAEQRLAQLPQEIQQRLRPYYDQLADDAPAVDMRPAPEQLPPRRQGGI